MARLSRFLICCALVLTSCGDGGGNGGGLTVVPGSPTPSPSPTSTPTPGASGELKPSATAAAFATTQFLTLTGTTQMLMGGSTTSRSVTGLNSAFSLSYDTPSGTYTLHNEERTRSFGPGSFTSEKSVPDYFPRVEYHLSAAGTEDFLVFFKQANATPAIVTNYSAYGAWQHNEAQASGTRARLDYFIYGTPTPASSMPHSGIVTYRWSGTGNYASDSQLYFTQSYSTMTVDFSTGQVTTYITLTGSDFLNDSFGGLIGTSFTGQISGNAADGALQFTGATYTGSAHVVFFGPNAENVGIVYSATSPVAASFNGAAVGTTP